MAFQVSQRANVTLRVLRGRRVVKRYVVPRAPANRTVRRSLPVRGLRRGDYKVRATAVAGTQRVTRTLVSRRL
jgi:hypothetical protein